MIQPKVKVNRKKKEIKIEKVATVFIYGIFIFAIIVLFFTAKSMFFPSETSSQMASQSTIQAPEVSKMSLTNYDKELARQMMDKNNDGKCDVCGMPVETCIDSGQLQCNMDSESTIGVLGSTHIHADFKTYVNGKSINFANPEYYMKSSFIHVDDNQNKEDASGVLHIHASGVPLWIFFDSISLELPSEMKAYVNGKEILDYKNYVFEDSDKILITDGKGDLQKQLDSVTDFAKNN